MDAGFKVPQIPTIFVNELPAPVEPRKRKVSVPKSALKPENKNEAKPEVPKEEPPVSFERDSAIERKEPEKSSTTENHELKFCHSCSTKVLSYFKPLQKYVNEVVSIAEETVGTTSTDTSTPPAAAENLLKALSLNCEGQSTSVPASVENYSNSSNELESSRSAASPAGNSGHSNHHGSHSRGFGHSTNHSSNSSSSSSNASNGNYRNNDSNSTWNAPSTTLSQTSAASGGPSTSSESQTTSGSVHHEPNQSVHMHNSGHHTQRASSSNIQGEGSHNDFSQGHQSSEQGQSSNEVEHNQWYEARSENDQQPNSTNFEQSQHSSNRVQQSHNVTAEQSEHSSHRMQQSHGTSFEQLEQSPHKVQHAAVAAYEHDRPAQDVNYHAPTQHDSFSAAETIFRTNEDHSGPPPNAEEAKSDFAQSPMKYDPTGASNDTPNADYPFPFVQNEPLYSNLDEKAELCASPFALVTIACSNLAATNAIILANSFHLTNNNMIYIDQEKSKKALLPFVVVLGGTIDPLIKSSLYTIFDEVISETEDLRLSLLNNKMLGLQLYKLQLWKAMSKYNKCLFIESSCVVVGSIVNMFFECGELSAAVDWLFPDYFNCSVFMFQPTLDTYTSLVSFAMSLQLSSNQLHFGDAVDEMTVLNQYFAGKWNKLSFIYNYVQHDAVYSQQPAFMRYGCGIKIVNFGYSGVGLSPQTGPNPNVVAQPWHVLFDLLASNHSGEVITQAPINNFVKYYLAIFMKRQWPLIQRHMTTLILKQNFGRRDWTVFELIQLFSSKSGLETDDHMFTQQQITLRRKKSVEERIAKVAQSAPNEDLPSEEVQVEESTEIKEAPPSESQGAEPSEVESSETLEKEEEQVAEVDPNQEKNAWEAGRIDWMGAHCSDNIIKRIQGKIGGSPGSNDH